VKKRRASRGLVATSIGFVEKKNLGGIAELGAGEGPEIPVTVGDEKREEECPKPMEEIKRFGSGGGRRPIPVRRRRGADHQSGPRRMRQSRCKAPAEGVGVRKPSP